MLWGHCAHAYSSGQQNFVKSLVETAWIMAEIKPYSFETVRNSSESEEDDVHCTRVKMGAEEEIK